MATVLDVQAIGDGEFPVPDDPSLAAAFWCDMEYFLVHTGTGGHPPCRCAEGRGHNDPSWYRVNQDAMV